VTAGEYGGTFGRAAEVAGLKPIGKKIVGTAEQLPQSDMNIKLESECFCEAN
jgi:hypothetical protein